MTEDTICEIQGCKHLGLYKCSHHLMCEKHMREHFIVYDRCMRID